MNQTNQILAQTKDLFRRRYRKVIMVVERFIDRELHIYDLHAEGITKLLFNENKAICRLLEKNLYRKDPYSLEVISKIIQIISRNLKTTAMSLSQKHIDFYPSSNNAKQQVPLQYFKYKNISLSVYNKYVIQFMQVYLRCCLVFSLNLKKYAFVGCREQLIGEVFPTLNKISVRNTRIIILKAQLQLHQACLYYQLKKNNVSQKCCNLALDEIMEAIFLIHQVNQAKPLKLKKYLQNRCFKLLILCLNCFIKNKIEVGQQYLAHQLILMFLTILKEINAEIPIIKRYLTLEIINYQHFLLYREQKSELISIIRNYIKEKLTIKPQKQKPNILDFYNMNMYGQENLIQNNVANNLNKISLKSNLTEDKKTYNRRGQNKKTFRNSTDTYRNKSIDENLIQKDSYFQDYLTFRKNTRNNILPTQKSLHMYQCSLENSEIQMSQYQRKPRKTQKSIIFKNFQKKQNKGKGPQFIYQQLINVNELVDFEKKRLKYKKRQVTDYTIRKNNDSTKAQISSSVYTDANLFLLQKKLFKDNNRSKDSNEFFQNQNKVKHQSRIQFFISLIIKNKEYLGVKKLVQKIQTVKKRKQFRQKARASRNQSVELTLKGLMKYQYLASQLLKHSMLYKKQDVAEIIYKIVDQQKLRLMNYEVGQKTIQNLTKVVQMQIEKVKDQKNKVKKNKLKKKPLAYSFNFL